ncbi:hypothetical protein ACGFNU_39290 [Spirillospora sp. NPDC048911]|uniref:hypothetical protein n=1 Tax=Spirillospora sp. NPDC048911 TaxID=3364527 RepID=UPI003715E55C
MQGLAEILWRDVLVLVEAVRAVEAGRDVDTETVTAAAAATRRGLDDLVARVRRALLPATGGCDEEPVPVTQQAALALVPALAPVIEPLARGAERLDAAAAPMPVPRAPSMPKAAPVTKSVTESGADVGTDVAELYLARLHGEDYLLLADDARLGCAAASPSAPT